MYELILYLAVESFTICMKRPKNVWKLDPKSDRYRICPECDKAFMTNHLSRDFCTKKCANDYNNKKKRLERSSELVLSTDSYPASRNSEQVSVEKKNEGLIQGTNSPILKTQEIDSTIKSKMRKCFQDFLGTEQEVQISMDQVKERNIDLTDYDTLEKLPHCDLRKANYGDYSIVWVQADTLLLTYQKYLLWTSVQ